MPQILEPLADRTAPSPGTTAAVLALFAASGCAALIYQVVWFEQLSLAIGSSALSLAVLLATFMGGLGLGSLLGEPRNRRELCRRCAATRSSSSVSACSGS